jgi:hypothetical protein
LIDVDSRERWEEGVEESQIRRIKKKKIACRLVGNLKSVILDKTTRIRIKRIREDLVLSISPLPTPLAATTFSMVSMCSWYMSLLLATPCFTSCAITGSGGGRTEDRGKRGQPSLVSLQPPGW